MKKTWGERFPDMGQVYDQTFALLAEKAANQLELQLKRGVYVGLCGPSLETPAEIRFLKTIGADAVGFSTVQEAIVATHAKMKILGFSVITNVHNPDKPAPVKVEHILQIAKNTGPKINDIIRKLPL